MLAAAREIEFVSAISSCVGAVCVAPLAVLSSPALTTLSAEVFSPLTVSRPMIFMKPII